MENKKSKKEDSIRDGNCFLKRRIVAIFHSA